MARWRGSTGRESSPFPDSIDWTAARPAAQTGAGDRYFRPESGTRNGEEDNQKQQQFQ